MDSSKVTDPSKMRLPPKLGIICALVAFGSNWQFGYQITYVNTAVDTFYELFNLVYAADNNGTSITSSEWSWQWSLSVSCFYPGAIFGFLLVPYGVRRFGLRVSYLLSAIPGIIGCIIDCCSIVATYGDPADSSQKLFVLVFIVGRMLIGVHGGAAVALLPLWIREVSPPNQRGFLSAFQQVAQAATTLIGMIIGSPSLDDVRSSFLLLQIVALIPTLIFVILIFILPGTPHHYFHRKPDWKQGEKSIVFYYCSDIHLEYWTLSILREWGTHASEDYTLKELIRPETKDGRLVRKGFFLGVLAAMSYAFTADDIIDSYSADILDSLGTDWASAFTILLGVILLVSSVFGCWLVERLGRRITLIGGLFATALSNSLAVLFLNISSSGSTLTYLCVVCLCVTKLCIGLGAGAPAWFLASELVTPTARTLAQTISTAFLLGMSGVVTALFMIMEDEIGSYSILILASIPALVSASMLTLYLPETRGKSIDAILLDLDRKKLSKNFFIKYESEPRYGTFDDSGVHETSGINLAHVNGHGEG